MARDDGQAASLFDEAGEEAARAAAPLAVRMRPHSLDEVIAFPKAASGLDPLTGAPTPITEAQRKEAGIDVRPGPPAH